MKISVNCQICSESCLVSIYDKRIVPFECTNKHDNTIIIQSHLSEMLFDRACLFYIQSDYRESIFNFYASLEKFREMFIKYALLKSNNTNDEIKQFWSHVSSQSERQYGAYCVMRLLEKQEPLDKSITQKVSEVRNQVIHNGKIPNKEEAYQFGHWVFELIKNDYSYLSYNKTFLSIVADELLSASEVKGATVTILFPGFQLINRVGQSFESMLNHIEEQTLNSKSWYCNK
ncbi:TPA: hypothetical protein JBJ04_14580 [Legionella pneumophila]|nr:hypothetical protein [Legionella pneumophila]